MRRTLIDFKSSTDPKQMRLLCRGVASHEYIPIPAPGDTVRLFDKKATVLLHVNRRHFHYSDEWTQVELFCTKLGK